MFHLPSALELLSDEQLEAHLKARISPEIVEYVRRRASCPRPESDRQSSSAYFNYALGVRDGKAELLAYFTHLLSEATNPENL